MLHFRGPVTVADQAADVDRPVEMILRAKQRRQVPLALLRVPTDRRLKQVAVPIGDIGSPARAGAERITDLARSQRSEAPGRSSMHLLMEHLAVAALDHERQAERLERIVSIGAIALQRRRLGNRRERLGHGVMTIARGYRVMTIGADSVTDILHVGTD